MKSLNTLQDWTICKARVRNFAGDEVMLNKLMHRNKQSLFNNPTPDRQNPKVLSWCTNTTQFMVHNASNPDPILTPYKHRKSQQLATRFTEQPRGGAAKCAMAGRSLKEYSWCESHLQVVERLAHITISCEDDCFQTLWYIWHLCSRARIGETQ